MSPAQRLRSALHALRMVPLAIVLPVLKRPLPLPRLVALLTPRRSGRVGAGARREEVVRAAWWASRVQFWRFPDNCLERSLIVHRHLILAGERPHLLVGMRREGTELLGHAWVTVEGQPVHDPVGWAAGFRVLGEFDERGRRIAGTGDG